MLDTDITDITQLNVEDDEPDNNRTSDESLISETNKLLALIQQSGPTSENGSLAFLSLCLQLEQIDDLNIYEKLLSKYKTKKIFKYFVEASAVVHKRQFFNLILSHLTKLKNKWFLGKCILQMHALFKCILAINKS